MGPEIGTELPQIGHYQMRQRIAEGGFGVVYLAHDPRLARDVAIKILHPHHASEPSRVARFIREARSAAKLNDPGIVHIYDVIETEGRMAIIMEFVRGTSLDIYLREHKYLTLADKLEIAAQIADTLHTAHEAGIVHRDVKPANVLMDEAGKVKLSDFSLARLIDTTMTPLTGENNILGTPAYMSPEQCQGREAMPQSDLYSLGIIIYEMAAGNRPFEAENFLALLRHHTDSPPTPIRLIKPDLPVELEQLLVRCLAKEIDKRPASGQDLARELRAMISKGIEDPSTSSSSKTVEIHYTEPLGMTPPPMQVVLPTPQPFNTSATPTPTPVKVILTTPAPFQTPAPTAQQFQVPPQTPQPFQAAGVTPQPVQMTPYGLQAQGVVAPQVPPSQPLVLGGDSLVYAPKKRRRALPFLTALFLALLAVGGGAVFYVWNTNEALLRQAIPRPVASLWSYETPLADYVKAPDDNFSYRLHSQIPGPGYNAYVLDMTSQTWHADKVSPPVWRHWLTIVVPERVTSEKALIVMSQGLSAQDRPLAKVPEMILAVAMSTKSIVAILEGFPRDPLGFHDVPTDASMANDRDRFVVETFMRFMDTGDPTWPIVCPMVKTVVRTMDAVQFYAARELRLMTPVNKFVLTGDSNGWGTWLTGAVDNRVVGIAPIQFDLLNIGQQIEHEISYRGGLSDFLSYFETLGLMPLIDSERGERLLNIIDPYRYRNLLTMPKLVLLPSNSNPYTEIDGANLYCNDLRGMTSFFCTPNLAFTRSNPFLPLPATPAAQVEGGVPAEDRTQDFRNALQVFYHRAMVDKPMPQFTWNVAPDGTFEVVTQDKPSEVRLWLSKSDSRDFGADAESGGPAWQMERLGTKLDGVYRGKVILGQQKYTAFYVELVFPSLLGINFSLTTPPTILSSESAPSQIAPAA